MANLTYNCIDSAWSWESNTDIVYDAVYDKEKNCTTITFGNCSHTYYGISGYGTVGSTKIAVVANDNSDSKVTSIFSTAGVTNGGVSVWDAESSGTSAPKTIIVQHSSSSGEKSITISATTEIRAYVGNVSQQSFNSSDSVSIIVGTKNDDAAPSNSNFDNRNQSLVYNHMVDFYAWESIATVEYVTIYDPVANATTITFTGGELAYSGEQNYNTSSTTLITITPTDNVSGAKTLTMTYDGVTNGEPINTFTPTFSSNSITVYHSGENSEKYITILGDTTLSVYFMNSTQENPVQSNLNFNGSMTIMVGTNAVTIEESVDVNHISFLLGWLTGRNVMTHIANRMSKYQWTNILGAAGKVLTTRDGDAVKTYAEYSIGEMPLSFQTSIEGSIGYGTMTKGNNLNDVHFYPQAKAGDFIEIYFTLPKYSCDYADTDGLNNQWIYLYGVTPEGAQNQPVTYMGWSQYSNGWQTTNKATSSRDRMIDDDFTYDFFRDENGNVISFRFSGTLLYDVEKFYCNATLNYELPLYDDQGKINVARGNNFTEFASYDDFRYRVVKAVQ